MSEKTRVRISLFGKVQGVNFRNQALKLAKEIAITGYVANMLDGSVLITAEGTKKAIDKFVDFCKTGPKNAKIERCEPYFQRYRDEFRKFEIK